MESTECEGCIFKMSEFCVRATFNESRITKLYEILHCPGKISQKSCFNCDAWQPHPFCDYEKCLNNNCITHNTITTHDDCCEKFHRNGRFVSNGFPTRKVIENIMDQLETAESNVPTELNVYRWLLEISQTL